jgi:hypothetical protein
MDGGNNVARAAFRRAAGMDSAGFDFHDRLEYTESEPLVATTARRFRQMNRVKD